MNEVTLAHFLQIAQQAWPEDTALEWDRVGLVSGRSNWPVRRVLLAVDAVAATVAEATKWDADVLFTHHPLLLRGVTTISADTSKGDLLTSLIESRCALYSAHTNADAPADGVSDVLAREFGIRKALPIEPGETAHSGIGRVGDLEVPITLADFAQKVSSVLPETSTGVRVAGDPNRMIRRVALCGGAGDSLLGHPAVRSADAYVTSDLRHHPAQESLEQSGVTGGPALLDVSHWASESLWLAEAQRYFAQRLPSVEFRLSMVNTDPWSFTVR